MLVETLIIKYRRVNSLVSFSRYFDSYYDCKHIRNRAATIKPLKTQENKSGKTATEYGDILLRRTCPVPNPARQLRLVRICHIYVEATLS